MFTLSQWFLAFLHLRNFLKVLDPVLKSALRISDAYAPHYIWLSKRPLAKILYGSTLIGLFTDCEVSRIGKFKVEVPEAGKMGSS